MAKVFIEESTLTNIGDAIREKDSTTELIPVTDMATRIKAISGGGYEPSAEDLVITGIANNYDCGGRFDWLIEKYGHKITTQDIASMYQGFYGTKLSRIPFDLNFNNNEFHDISTLFAESSLTEIPRINNCRPSGFGSVFNNCTKLRHLPEDFAEQIGWSWIDSNPWSGWNGSFNMMYSLRELSPNIYAHAHSEAEPWSSFYRDNLRGLYVIDELIDLPANSTVEWQENAFWDGNNGYTFNALFRAKAIKFKQNPETNQPYTVRWTNQTIKLTSVGYLSSKWLASLITSHNSGITADKHVTDDVTYQALKDDPDMFTSNVAYSRYNKASALETINSLPDTSAYIAEVGGTNTITFRGDIGGLTEGGAINSLTPEEIAIATAKGWTVSLV